MILKSVEHLIKRLDELKQESEDYLFDSGDMENILDELIHIAFEIKEDLE